MGATLTRFFGLHVAVLPALTIGILIAHLLLVQKFGTSVPASVEKEWDEHPWSAAKRCASSRTSFCAR